jgi:hypothetical protein
MSLPKLTICLPCISQLCKRKERIADGNYGVYRCVGRTEYTLVTYKYLIVVSRRVLITAAGNVLWIE